MNWVLPRDFFDIILFGLVYSVDLPLKCPREMDGRERAGGGEIL